MMFLDCAAYLDQDGAARCGLPAEVQCSFTMGSTDGPLESAKIRCPAGRWFQRAHPIPHLARQADAGPGAAATASGAKRGGLTGGNDGPDGSAGFAVRVIPREPGLESPRPNSAPAYYLGRPASL